MRAAKTTTLNRRTFLGGVGAAMALPLLESMIPYSPFARTAAALAQQSQLPARVAFVFIPNGVHFPEWTPAETGAGYALTAPLEPLARHQDEFSLLSGLAQLNARALGDGPGDHARSAACFLTGAHPRKTAGTDIRVGESIDQVLAQQLGRETRLASLELGIEGGRQSGQCDSGYACAYSNNIAWRSATAPMTKEIHPRLAFERLFMLGSTPESAEARAERIRKRRSVLDYVTDDAKRLRKRVGREDRDRLEDYFTGVRKLEKRLEQVEREGVSGAAGLELPRRIPRDYREHIDLMSDILVLAFRLDLTRVTTYMLGNEGSGRQYRHLDIKGGHHQLSHHRGDAAMIESIKKIDRFQSEVFAQLLDKLAAVPEGEERLLDRTLLIYGGAIGDGNRHNHDQLPILLAGGRSLGWQPGKHLKWEEQRSLCDLFLTTSEMLGVPLKRFGDSQGKLSLA